MQYVIRKENPPHCGNVTRELMKKRPPKRTDLRPTTVQIRVFPDTAKKLKAWAATKRVRVANIVSDMCEIY